MHIIFHLSNARLGACLCFLLVLLSGAAVYPKQSQDPAPPNSLTDAEIREGWKLLFDGKTSSGWRGINQESFPEHGWEIRGGMLIVNESGGGESANGGDIITTRQYGNFILEWEWKMLTKGGNSGVKYFVKEGLSDNKKYGAGLEYQLLDDENFPWMFDGRMKPGDYRTLAALYELYPATNRSVKPLGAWNHSRVVVRGKHSEHWLNGVKVLEYERGSEDFRKKVAESKFAAYENFAEADEGHILLQDHGSEMAFRSIKIKELMPALGDHPLFVFNNGVKDETYDTPEKQVQLLKSLGYDGMEKKGVEELAETLDALDQHGLELYTMYLNINLDTPEQPYDPELREVFKLLEGRPTMPWFYITSKKYKPSSAENDAIAVPIMQEIADMAAEYGIRIMIYPHVNFWVDNVDDALRVVEKADRPNLGITFNLCHFLANQGVKANESLIPTIDKAMPYVFAISLNGADRPTAGIMEEGDLWDHFIQPLGQGNFDTYAYLNAFIERGFNGPVGLQCYAIEEEKPSHLKKSITAWNSFVKQAGAETKNQ